MVTGRVRRLCLHHLILYRIAPFPPFAIPLLAAIVSFNKPMHSRQQYAADFN